MAPVIPVKCSEIEAAPGRLVTHMEFTIPSLSREFIAEFTPSRTSAAIKRLQRIIDMEIAAAPVDDIVDAMEKFLKAAKRAQNATLTDDEVAEYRRANGWDIEPAPVEVAPAPVEPVAPVEDAPVVTSDGRYIVDPAAGTIEPVEDIPADIVAVMPVWEVTDSSAAQNACVEFWPRSFDIAPGMEAAFEVEQIAAEKLLPEIGELLWGAAPRDIAIGDSPTNRADLTNGGAFFAPDGCAVPDRGAPCPQDS